MNHPLTRREAVASLAGIAAFAALPRLRAEDKKPAAAALPATESSPTPMTDASFHHSVCKWCYPKISLDALAGAAKGIGLDSIELLDPADWPVVQRHGPRARWPMARPRFPSVSTGSKTTPSSSRR
jgi:hydroxypyruvate isomerase